MPSTLRGLLNDQLLLLVNMTQWVLRWLSLSLLFLHHRLIIFRLFCDTSLKVSASYHCLPLVCLGAVTIDTSAKSSANPCRSLGILLLVYSSRETNIRDTNIFFSYILQQYTIQNKLLQQTIIPITIPYIHSINKYKRNSIILHTIINTNSMRADQKFSWRVLNCMQDTFAHAHARPKG